MVSDLHRRAGCLATAASFPSANTTHFFSLLGTTFGGDGQTTFGLPALSGTVAVGAGQGPGLQTYVPGQNGGQPAGWADCTGQLLPINQNQALFALLGTTYGGDGRSTFALPDLRGRVAIGQGQGAQLSPRAIGDTGGEENHGLTTAELPAHTHAVGAVGNPSSTAVIGPAGNLLSVGAGRSSSGPVAVNVYGSGIPGVAMHASTIGASPGAQAHANMMPFLAVTPCIALVGIFPSRN